MRNHSVRRNSEFLFDVGDVRPPFGKQPDNTRSFRIANRPNQRFAVFKSYHARNILCIGYRNVKTV